MADFSRIPQKFRFRGICLNAPVDLVPEGKVPFAKNVRTRIDGKVEARPGLSTQSTTLGGVPHSCRRLNSSLAGGSFQHILGGGTKLYYAALPGGAVEADTGYSGNPLSLIPFRPEESPEAWMYVFDGNKLRKIRTDGTDYPVGIGAPLVRPVVASGGAGTLDNSASSPYYYRFRYRSSLTGVRSNPSPPSVDPGITVTSLKVAVTVYASIDSQVGRIDIFRFGGTLASDGKWYYIGSTDNANTTFYDDMSDADAQVQETLSFDNDVPFVTQDVTQSGTCNVSGTTVTATSGAFNIRWPDGTIIQINGIPTRVCGQPSSSFALEIYDNLGTLSGVAWQAESPAIVGQPLPCAWGPYGGGQSGEFIFATGDTYRPGAVYWTNGNNPDGASAANYLEVTSPSERMQHGCMYDGSAFAFSISRMFVMRPSFDTTGGPQFTALEVPNGKGLWARWALAVGPMIWFLSRDGIYETSGGTPRCITDEDLYPLFPHEGVAGQTVNGIKPPNMANETRLRLSYADGLLYFNYAAADGSPWTLVYDPTLKAWSYDAYWEQGNAGDAYFHYADEAPVSPKVYVGTGADAVYSFGGTTDGAINAVNCELWTRVLDAGDSRTRKHWGDILLDCDSGTGNFTVTTCFDNFTASVASGSVGNPNNGRQQSVIDLYNGNGNLARNIALKIVWQAAQGASLFEWQPSVVAAGKPESTVLRATDWTDEGVTGRKLFRGIIIEADTSGIDRIVSIQKDGDSTGPAATITVNHNGQSEKAYGFAQPFEAHLVRIAPTDQKFWRLFKWRWIAEPYPEDAALIEAWTDAGTPGAKYVYGCIIQADTANVSRTLTVQKDGDAAGSAASLTVQHDGRIAKAYEFSPFVAHTLRLKPNGALKNFQVTWLVDPYPETASFTPDFQTIEGKGTRQIRGFILEADTFGSAVNVQLQVDGSTYTTISVNHTGRAEKAYGFPPKIGHEFRLVPLADWRFFSVRWIYDEYPEFAPIYTDWDRSDVMVERYYRGVVLEADTGGLAKSIQVQYDGGTVGATLQALHNGCTQVAYAFPTPFIASLVRFAPLGDVRIFRWKWLADDYRNRTSAVTAWEDAGHAGAKFVQGVVLTADTGGIPVSVPVQYDEQQSGPTLAVSHNGLVTKPYSFEPFIAHNLRFAPLSAWRYFQAQWVWEPVPEAATTWVTQGTTFDAPGFVHVRRAMIALMSSAVATLTVNIDGTNYTYQLISTGGQYRKLPVIFRAAKGKLHSFRVESQQPLRLFVKDCEVYFKAWGSAGPYQIARPFGDVHRLAGARI